jgi:hypothetical protein
VVRRRPFAFLAILSAAVTAAACGGSEPSAPAARRAEAAAPSGAERYFPLEEGRLYHYVTSEGGEPGMLVAKVRRTDAAHGELRLSDATKRFSITPDGVAYVDGAFLLKAPLELGSSWPGEHGGRTKIVATDASVDVAAGHFGSCLTTVEEGGRPEGSRYATTYCPGVGMVLLVVTAGGREARAELKSYGMPVKIP